MREKHPSPKFDLATALCTVLCVAGIFAGRTLASDDHLPEKAKIVAAKFEIFKETAKPSAVAAKRKQVITYLGKLLEQEAAAANLDGALALHDLIGSINGTKPKPPAAGEEKNPAPADPTAKPEGLEQVDFSLGQQRRVEFPFFVASDKGEKTLRCELTGASDNSGDRGLNYQLIDPRGKVSKSGFLQSEGSDVVTHKTSLGGDWKLVIIDEDTDTDPASEFPGNHGTVQVRVMRPEAALASNRRAR